MPHWAKIRLGARIHTMIESIGTNDNYWVTRIRSLIEQKADVNTRNSYDQTLLHIACRIGNLEVVRLLINARADLDHFSEAEPPHFASWHSGPRVLELLINAGVDVNTRDGFDKTFVQTIVDAFRYGPHDDATALVELLIAAGATVENCSNPYRSGATGRKLAAHLRANLMARLPGDYINGCLGLPTAAAQAMTRWLP